MESFVFHHKVFPEPMSGCCLWIGVRDKNGYGKILVKHRQTLAHRHSFALVNGPIPEGKIICHKCNNPPCVNPDHLYAGDKRDNFNDLVRAGGFLTFGSATINAKLTEEQIVEIRRLRRSGLEYKAIAKMFGVGRANIGMIVNRKTWKHVNA